MEYKEYKEEVKEDGRLRVTRTDLLLRLAPASVDGMVRSESAEPRRDAERRRFAKTLMTD